MIPFWKKARWQVPKELNRRNRAVADAALAQMKAMLRRIDMEDDETLKVRTFKPEEIKLLEDIIKETRVVTEEILAHPRVRAAPDYAEFSSNYINTLDNVEADFAQLKKESNRQK